MLKDESLKVALFLPNLGGGGAERITVYLAEGFANRGVQTDLVLAKADGPYLSQVSANVNIVDLGESRALLSVGKLSTYLSRVKPSAIISALNYTNLLTLAATKLAQFDGKTIITLHNQFTVPRETKPSFKERAITYLMRRFYGYANEIVAVSNGVSDDAAVTLGLDRETVKTIYNPVISDAVLARGQEVPKEDWLNSHETPVFLGIGRFHEQKDFPNLVRAFKKVRDKVNCHLIILGDGPDRKDLEKLILELKLQDSVKLPGFADNPYAYLSRADVFVLSSKWEGLPTVLIEALAFGRKIVSTDCKSGPDEILLSGEYGTLVPVGDSELLAEAMCDALTKPKVTYDAAKASKRFTYELSIQSYLDLVKK